MSVRLTTCNVNNLFVRYKFGRAFPGASVPRDAGGTDDPPEVVSDARRGFLPLYQRGSFEIFGPQQRDLTVKAIKGSAGGRLPEILCLQEVESLLALREFNDRHLAGHYPNALVIDSRDFRQIDVALLTTLPILGIRTHIDELATGQARSLVDPDRPQLFSRDCLEVDVTLPDGQTLTLAINHLKSQFVDLRDFEGTAEERAAEEERQTKRNDELRRAQAKRIAEIIAPRNGGLLCVIGDLNQLPGHPSIKPIYQDAGLIDALAALPRHERWTHWYRGENTVGHLDHLLLTEQLNRRVAEPPVIERRGISFKSVLQDGLPGPKKTRLEAHGAPLEQIEFRFERFPEVTPKLYASDHCPITLTID